jgi:hypothetical protein
MAKSGRRAIHQLVDSSNAAARPIFPQPPAGHQEPCMTSKSGYMLVGAFVLVLAAAFIWGILWISAGGTPQSLTRYVVYMTDSVSGLNVDAPLRYRGVDVGKVEQISIDNKN